MPFSANIYVNLTDLISHISWEIENSLQDIVHNMQDYTNSEICTFSSVAEWFYLKCTLA